MSKSNSLTLYSTAGNPSNLKKKKLNLANLQSKILMIIKKDSKKSEQYSAILTTEYSDEETAAQVKDNQIGGAKK
jgi:hypothetical protein